MSFKYSCRFFKNPIHTVKFKRYYQFEWNLVYLKYDFVFFRGGGQNKRSPLAIWEARPVYITNIIIIIISCEWAFMITQKLIKWISDQDSYLTLQWYHLLQKLFFRIFFILQTCPWPSSTVFLIRKILSITSHGSVTRLNRENLFSCLNKLAICTY